MELSPYPRKVHLLYYYSLFIIPFTMIETNLYTVTIPVMSKALGALDKMLDKVTAAAESKKSEWHPAAKFEEALLNDRIIFDQFPLVRQVQIACDNLKGAAARLSETEAPKYEDTEKTVAELKARIAKTLEYVKTIMPDQLIGKENTMIALPYGGGTVTGFDYATLYVLPNFFFHFTTAYAIMRKNGIELGKSDFFDGLPLK